MKVVIKKPNEKGYIDDIPNELEAFQKIVGGYIECLTFPYNVVLVINDEGKLEGLEPNIAIQTAFGGDVIAGNIVFCSAEGEDFTDIEAGALEYLQETGIL